MSAHDAWRAIADHFKHAATRRQSEGPAVQLACLVLAEYCDHLWAGSDGGPTLAMLALAEHLVGDRVDDVVAAELTKIAVADRDEKARQLS